MKLYQKLTVAAVAGFMSFSAVSAEKMSAADSEAVRNAAQAALAEKGYDSVKIGKMLRDPNNAEATSAICTICTQLGSLIGDNDASTGCAADWKGCGAYIATNMVLWVAANKPVACKAAVKNKSLVCGEKFPSYYGYIKPIIDKALQKACSSEGFTGC